VRCLESFLLSGGACGSRALDATYLLRLAISKVATAVAEAANVRVAARAAALVAVVSAGGGDSSGLGFVEDPEAEREWQRLRLAAYGLGEVNLAEPRPVSW
jgi:hypothetical protein